jgi:tetratricopeptide (TPR) repeat protein
MRQKRTLLIVFVLCPAGGMTQDRRVPQDSIDSAIVGYQQARRQGRFEEAAALRAQARALLDQAPAASPEFQRWPLVSESYKYGRTPEERAVYESALARVARSGGNDLTRDELLGALARSWDQDGEPLRALEYREQAVALDGDRQTAPTPMEARRNLEDYHALMGAYQQLGRPQEIPALMAKAKLQFKNDDAGLASLLFQAGQADEAAVIYKRMAEQASTARNAADAWQLLANLHTHQGRADDAVAALRQGIEGLQRSDQPGVADLIPQMRWRIALILHRAGQDEQADQVLQQRVAESPPYTRLSALLDYTQFLNNAGRAKDAESLLSGYLADHPELDTNQKGNVLMLLSRAAWLAGDREHAVEYGNAAAETWPKRPAGNSQQDAVNRDLNGAQNALYSRQMEESFTSAMQAIGPALDNPDRDQNLFGLVSIADGLIPQRPDLAERMYQRLMAAVQDWLPDTPQPLITVAQAYTCLLLMARPERWKEVPAAIERLGSLVSLAHGANAGSKCILDMAEQFEERRGHWAQAIAASHRLLALEESRSGTTSIPYLLALRTLARLYQSSGDPARALSIHTQMVTISDRTANNMQRLQTRIDGALALARQRHFDEAERLATEAVAIDYAQRLGTDVSDDEAGLFLRIDILDQVRRLEKSAQ